MSFRNVYMMLTVAGLSLTACTSGPRAVQVDTPTAPDHGVVQDPKNGASASKTDHSGQAGIKLDKADFEKYALDIANLTYKFTFLTVVKEDKLLFDVDNKATLIFKDLPSETPGTITLEVSQAGKLVMRGTADATLKKGENTKVQLKLSVVDPNAGGNGSGNSNTTDLTIDVTLDNNTGGNPPPPTTTNPPPPTTTNPPPPTTTTPPPTTTVDPIASWDGKSNLGNSRWTIVPVSTP